MISTMRCIALLLLAVSAQAATSTLPGTDPNIYWIGKWTQNTGYKQAGNAQKAQRVDFAVVGTDLSAQLYGGYVYAISIDGGTYNNVTPAGGTWIWQSIFTGLSDATHTVSFWGSAGLYVRTDSMVQITGAAPAFTAFPGYGPLVTVSASSYLALDGSPKVSTTGAYNGNDGAYWVGAEGGIRFRAAITGLTAWLDDLYFVYLLFQDGVQVNTITNTTNTATWKFVTLASGLDGLTHDYELLAIGNMDGGHGSNGGDLYLAQLMFIGGSGLAVYTPPARPTVGWFGDSIVTEVAVGLTDTRQGTGYLVTRPLGMSALRKGTSGAKVSTALRDGTAGITSGTPDPVVVILQGGVNDQAAAITIGTCCATAGTFSGDMKTMISNTAAGLPSTSTIVVRGILPNTATNYALRPDYVAAQQAAVASYMAGNPTVPAIFVSTDNWINPATDCISGGLHPNATGSAKIAAQEKLIVSRIVGCKKYGGGLSPVCAGVQ